MCEYYYGISQEEKLRILRTFLHEPRLEEIMDGIIKTPAYLETQAMVCRLQMEIREKAPEELMPLVRDLEMMLFYSVVVLVSNIYKQGLANGVKCSKLFVARD